MERIDYCNSLLYGLGKTQIRKLQRVQNMAARLVTNSTLLSHNSYQLVPMHAVEYRIKFKILLIAFKAIHDLALHYTSGHSLRSNDRIYNIQGKVFNGIYNFSELRQSYMERLRTSI